MSILKQSQSKSVGEMDPRPRAPESMVNRLDGDAVVDAKSLEKQRGSLESGIGSLSTIGYLTQESVMGEATFHPAGPSTEPQAELKVSPNSSMAAPMGRSDDFGGSNGPREADTTPLYVEPEYTVRHRGSERSPSNVSETSLVGTEGSCSARSSIDSAICMDNRVTRRTRRASVATNRMSMHSEISSDTIYEMPESPSDIEEGNPQVTDVNAEQVSNLQSTVPSLLQANEEAPEEYNATTDKPKTSRIVKLIRFLLRIATTCIRIPQVRSESEPPSFDDYKPAGDHEVGYYYTNSGYEDTSKEIYGNINSPTPTLRQEGVDCGSEVITHDNERKTDIQKPTFHEFTLEKKDFLYSFEWMLEQAKSQGIDVIGQNFQVANFAAAILDCHGGCLSIDDLDVHLYVPPGAIPVGKLQQIYISVTGTSSVDNHYFSTPFVHCGPPGTTFEEDVVLTMPHCVKDTSSCKFSLSKLSSGGSSELSEGLDVITIVDNDSITFSVNHFCGFGATSSPLDGTILKKSMVACVFIREDSLSDDEVALRLRLVDDVKVNLLEVEKKERKYGFHLADVESPLIVRKNDQDVVTKISNCSKSWEISDPESCQRKFDRDLLWPEPTASCAQASLPVMFFAKRCSGSQKNVCFKAHMTVYQEGSESCDYGVHFLVVAKQRVCPPVQEPQMNKTQQLLLYQLKLDDRVTASRLLEEPIFSKLCNLLDTPHPLEKDWRRLLTLLLNTGNGCSENVESIRDKAGREQRSPTKIVLDLFFGKQSSKKKEETMGILKCTLSGMNRPDAKFAVDAIEEQVKKWSETRQGRSTSTPHIPTVEITTDENANMDTDDKVQKNIRKDSAYNSGVVKADAEALKEKLENQYDTTIDFQ